MVRSVKLRKMGGSVGATLPKDLADRFHLEAGDDVLAVETAHGILLTPYDPEVDEGLAIAAEVEKRYRNALRELAK
jgi:putative addiction module antidote